MENSSERNEEIFDILLKNALAGKCREEAEDFLSAGESCVFSKEFEKKAAKTKRSIGREKRIKRSLRAARGCAVSVTTALGIIFVFMLTQESVSAAVENVIKSIFSDHDRFAYTGQIKSGDDFDSSKMPGIIPSGFTLKKIEYEEYSVSMDYADDEDGYISIHYGDARGTVINLDNEHHVRSEYTRDGVTYTRYDCSDPFYGNLILWYSDGYYYIIRSSLTQEDNIRIAQSLS